MLLQPWHEMHLFFEKGASSVSAGDESSYTRTHQTDKQQETQARESWIRQYFDWVRKPTELQAIRFSTFNRQQLQSTNTTQCAGESIRSSIHR